MGPTDEVNIDENIISGSYYISNDTKIALVNEGDYNVKLIGTGTGYNDTRKQDRQNSENKLE